MIDDEQKPWLFGSGSEANLLKARYRGDENEIRGFETIDAYRGGWFGWGADVDRVLTVRDSIRKMLDRHATREMMARWDEQDKVPRSLMDRPKAGFGLPIDDWLRGSLRTWAADLIADPLTGAFLDRTAVEHRWADHQASRRNNAYLLWDVLMFVDWARHRGIDASGLTADREPASDTSRTALPRTGRS